MKIILTISDVIGIFFLVSWLICFIIFILPMLIRDWWNRRKNRSKKDERRD